MRYTMDFLTQWLDHGQDAPQPRRADAGNAERLICKLSAARALRQLRIKAGLSQQQLAARLDLNVPEIVAIEIGEADCLRTLQVSERARRLLGAP